MEMFQETQVRRYLEGDSYFINMLFRRNAVRVGHIGLTAGGCTTTYFDKDRLLGEQPADQEICRRLAIVLPFRHDVKTIIGPERNGISLAYGLSLALCEITGQHYVHVEVYKNGAGGFSIPRQTLWRLAPPVLLVDDVVSTEKTMRQVTDSLEPIVAANIHYCCLIDRRRGGSMSVDGLVSLVRAQVPMYLPGEKPPCPDCQQNVPFETDVGHPR